MPTVRRCQSAWATKGPCSCHVLLTPAPPPLLPVLTCKPIQPPFSLTPHQWGAGTQLGRGGRGRRRSHLQPPPPASILGGPKTALWRTGQGCLPPGRFISSLFKPCSDFSMSPHPLPRHASLPSPSNPSAQPGERATGLQVIELLGGRQARVFCVSAFGFLPLQRGWGRGCDGGDSGPWASQTPSPQLSPVWTADEPCLRQCRLAQGHCSATLLSPQPSPAQASISPPAKQAGLCPDAKGKKRRLGSYDC